MKAPRQSESRNILTIKCDSKKASACGPDVAPDDIYSHKPLTSYQRECRGKPTTDIQHFTLTFRPQVVERCASPHVILTLCMHALCIPCERIPIGN